MDKGAKQKLDTSHTDRQKKKSLTLDIIVRKSKKPAARKSATLSASQKTGGSKQAYSPIAKQMTQKRQNERLSARTAFLDRLQSIQFNKKTVAGIILVLGVSSAGLWYLKSQGNDANKQANASEQQNADGNVTYRTVLPAGKSIDDLGGWQRVSPPEGDPVYAYTDTIDGVSVSVSQQPLPRSVKENADQWVTELAKKFNATNRISANGNSVYIGTSAKGPQSVIFRVDELLILIKSDSKIQDQSWATYARALM